MVPYRELPQEQRFKDTLFRSVVLGVKGWLEGLYSDIPH